MPVKETASRAYWSEGELLPLQSDKTLAEKIAYELRRDILRGTLLPGASIKERWNAEQQGVSRTPMREAIRILAQEGLVQLRPLRSPVVANPSLREITDQLRVLRALELLSGELACAEATDAEIKAIIALGQDCEKVYDSGDEVDAFEMDMQFHAAIVTASHNSALEETHSAYLARLWRARFLSARRRQSRARVLTQHAEICTALAARDAPRIKAAIDAHLGAMESNVASYFQDRNKPIPHWTQPHGPE